MAEAGDVTPARRKVGAAPGRFLVANHSNPRIAVVPSSGAERVMLASAVGAERSARGRPSQPARRVGSCEVMVMRRTQPSRKEELQAQWRRRNGVQAVNEYQWRLRRIWTRQPPVEQAALQLPVTVRP